ncbi:redoxin domain-containing protein [Chitinophaga sp. SYP-B3965]|uniref:TlpA disulfide reductase family protein n=1 Tax=Chitinophaga sp. SYP-B3965 TaxID=2663120 RepID=UPI001299D46B|nr:TlpA disulfide reductase family protein [Chitinophaga sp. SYP-B3965]MRG44379.1 redoxin domain-containing protein [Chitinophaga sp. SYP-B3965]
MKFSFLLLSVFAPVAAFAQTPNFTITGNIGKLDKPAKVYIDYSDTNGKGKEDSASVVNGVFTFKGFITGQTTARMSLDHEGKGKPFSIYSPGADVIYFYFGPEQIKVTSKDSLSNAAWKGSKIYDEHTAFNKKIGGSIMELTAMYQKEYAEASPEDKRDEEFMKALNAKQTELRKQRGLKMVEFAKTNPNSFFSLVALSEAAGSYTDMATAQTILSSLNKDLQKMDMAKELQQRINAEKLTAVGKPAPAFTQNDVNDKPLSLTDLKGKVVLLDFWASWCSPCRAENPNMLKQYKIYKDKGFEILSVSLDSKKEPWVEAIAQDGLPWLHVSDLKGWSNAAGRLYGVRGVPACYLIDRDGKIIATDVRGEKLNEKLAEIFKN